MEFDVNSQRTHSNSYIELTLVSLNVSVIKGSLNTKKGVYMRTLCFSWFYSLEDFRRLVVRWEYHAMNYLGFLHLACIRMLMKYL